MSKQVSNTLRKPLLKIGTSPKNYSAVYTLGQKVHDLILANVATFATPSPALATLATAITALKSAIKNKGNRFNRPSRNNIQIIETDAMNVRLILTQLLEYVNNVIPVTATPAERRAIYQKSGFTQQIIVRKPRVLTNHITFAAITSNNVSHQVRWRKPLTTQKGGKVLGYNFYQMNGDVQVFVGFTTKRTFQVAAAQTAKTWVIIPVTTSGKALPFKIKTPGLAT